EPAQRERERPRLLLRAPGARPQRDRRLGHRRRARALRRRLPRRRGDPPAHPGARRTDRRADRPGGHHGRDRLLARRLAHRARRLARSARRPRLPLRGGAARDGPRADRRAARAQGAAGRPV
ncbi:MAG: Glucose-6-phosphate isomerase, archaeal II / Mannose-6-phosphate isomerase, archaeal, partial [uncultured Solirubrobacteraceae bacterium]